MDVPEVMLRLSVVVLNYNGRAWLDRCLSTLASQRVVGGFEVILADNASPDGSGEDCRLWAQRHPWIRFLPLGSNLGFCAGNNAAARTARGKWLLFLNNDTWLEPDALERLVSGTEAVEAASGMPLILDYDDNSFQAIGFSGFDLFGLGVPAPPTTVTGPVLFPVGCAFLVLRQAFETVGGFDREFFMYADEADLGFKLVLAGHDSVAVPHAVIHHRGAANLKAMDDAATRGIRTSDTVRYYCNRNSLLVLLKVFRWIWIPMLPAHLFLLTLEGSFSGLVTRRWGHVKAAFLDAIWDAWRLRGHVRVQRALLSAIRKRGDLWMLRHFLTWRLNRAYVYGQFIRFGLPKVERR